MSFTVAFFAQLALGLNLSAVGEGVYVKISRFGRINQWELFDSPGIHVTPPEPGTLKRVAHKFHRSQKTSLPSKEKPCSQSVEIYETFDAKE